MLQSIPKSPLAQDVRVCFDDNQFSIRLVFLSSMWHFCYQRHQHWPNLNYEFWWSRIWGEKLRGVMTPVRHNFEQTFTNWLAAKQPKSGHCSIWGTWLEHKKSFPVYWRCWPQDIDPWKPAGSWEPSWQWAAWLLFAEPLRIAARKVFRRKCKGKKSEKKQEA